MQIARGHVIAAAGVSVCRQLQRAQSGELSTRLRSGTDHEHFHHEGQSGSAVTISVITLLIANAAVADEDDAIAARAKQALVEARLPDTAGIVVTSFNGEVDLDGVVRSEHMREEAARLVGGLRGVTAVGTISRCAGA